MSAPRLMSLFRVVGTKACVVRSASRGFPPSPIVIYSCTRVFFSAGYTCDVIEEAQVYTQHRSGEEVNLDDVKLAIHALLQNQFVKPPTADTMHQFAHSLNRVPLPPLNNRPGIHVPLKRRGLPCERASSTVKGIERCPKPCSRQASSSLTWI